VLSPPLSLPLSLSLQVAYNTSDGLFPLSFSRHGVAFDPSIDGQVRLRKQESDPESKNGKGNADIEGGDVALNMGYGKE